MDTQALLAIAVQIPLVVAFFTALQKGWIYVGRNVTEDRDQRIKLAEELRANNEALLAAANARAEQERADRIAADERLAKLTESLRQATEVMDRSVELHEQAILGAAQHAARPARHSG